MFVLTQAETEALLEPDALRQAMALAMADVSGGRASMPPRIAAGVPAVGGSLLAMPAYLESSGGLAAKLVTVFPQNEETGQPTHQGVVVVFDPRTGTAEALLDGTSITAARTAACSALSVELLARADSGVLTIIGTGVQARAHAVAVTRVRPFHTLRVVGRRIDRARAIAVELAEELALSPEALDDIDAACADSDVICATTHAAVPVVRGAVLPPGVHVTSVGYNTAGREVDSRAVARSLVVVESREAALAPPPAGANDLRIPIDEGVIGPEHIHAEIGELVLGTRIGRTSPEQLTLYKSVGVAAQDVAAATLVVRMALQRGIGREIPL